MNKKLDRNDWINAGLKTLAEKGVEAVRVEPLAKALNVTKGSFYWHFKNRTALLDALLDAWQARATMDIIGKVEAGGGEARSRLRALFEIVFSASGRLDLEIRNWGARDAKAEAALRHVDRTRLDYLESLFKELGFSPIEAAARAELAYHALIGQFAMAAMGVMGAPGIDKDARSNRTKRFDIIFEILVRRN